MPPCRWEAAAANAASAPARSPPRRRASASWPQARARKSSTHGFAVERRIERVEPDQRQPRQPRVGRGLPFAAAAQEQLAERQAAEAAAVAQQQLSPLRRVAAQLVEEVGGRGALAGHGQQARREGAQQAVDRRAVVAGRLERFPLRAVLGHPPSAGAPSRTRAFVSLLKSPPDGNPGHPAGARAATMPRRLTRCPEASVSPSGWPAPPPRGVGGARPAAGAERALVPAPAHQPGDRGDQHPPADRDPPLPPHPPAGAGRPADLRPPSCRRPTRLAREPGCRARWRWRGSSATPARSSPPSTPTSTSASATGWRGGGAAALPGAAGVERRGGAGGDRAGVDGGLRDEPPQQHGLRAGRLPGRERTALSYAVGEWARVWPLQALIRSMGAYFVRRDSGDALYRRVLERYVHMATRPACRRRCTRRAACRATAACARPSWACSTTSCAPSTRAASATWCSSRSASTTTACWKTARCCWTWCRRRSAAPPGRPWPPLRFAGRNLGLMARGAGTASATPA